MPSVSRISGLGVRRELLSSVSVTEVLGKGGSMGAKKLKFNQGFRKSLPLGERIKVIKQHEKTPSVGELSNMFKVSLTQIKNILRRKEEYLEEWDNGGNLARIKRRQSARFLTVGVVVCEWIYRNKRNGIELDDKTIVDVSREMADKLGMGEVRPSNNWLERMRTKFKICEEDLAQIYPSEDSMEESVELDDIVRDLRASCPGHEFKASLAFPYEVTRQYLKESKDEATDIAKVRMRNCLEIAKRDKYLSVDEFLGGIPKPDGCELSMDESATDEMTIDEDMDEAYMLDASVSVKTELIESIADSNDSHETNSSTTLLNDKQEMFPAEPNVCIKDEALKKGIKTYREAFNILGPLEHFSLAQEDITALGIINQLETHFRDKLAAGKK